MRIVSVAHNNIHKFFDIYENEREKKLGYSIYIYSMCMYTYQFQKWAERKTIRTMKAQYTKAYWSKRAKEWIFESSRTTCIVVLFLSSVLINYVTSVDNCVFLFHLNLIEFFFSKKNEKTTTSANRIPANIR